MTPDVRSACSRCASIFILYVTTSANNITLKNKRKTLSPQDVIEAIEQIGFEEFTPELTSFHDYIKTDRKLKQKSKKSHKESNESSNSKNSNHSIDNEEIADEEEICLSDSSDD